MTKKRWLPKHRSGARPVTAEMAAGRGKEQLSSQRWLTESRFESHRSRSKTLGVEMATGGGARKFRR